MKKRLYNKIVLFFLMFPVSIFAQDITGLWKGEMYVDSTKKYLPYEISISEVKGKLVGYSLISFEENGKTENGIRDITIERKDDQIIIEDVSLIDNSFTFVPPKNVKKTMVVTLTVDDTIMTMKGNWSTNRTKRFLSATGTVQMQRKNDYKAAALYKRLEVLKLSDNIVFKEPEKKPVAVMTVATAPSFPPPAVITKPAEEKKPPPVVLKETAPPPVAVTVLKPIEVKKEVPTVVKEAPPKPTVAVVNKPVAVKPPAPVIIKPAPVKTAPAPTVVAVTKPPEVKKAPVVAVKPTPPPVVSVPVQEKPKEIVVAVVEKKQAPVIMPSIIQGAADVDKRSIATTQTVYYEQDSLLLTLYDNGDVDGDTVSVLMNGEVIFSKQGLSTKANSKKIAVSSDSVQMIMYAENLGSIPPNTGLLIIMDGEKRYEVRFSADLKSNAAILFRRKKLNN